MVEDDESEPEMSSLLMCCGEGRPSFLTVQRPGHLDDTMSHQEVV